MKSLSRSTAKAIVLGLMLVGAVVAQDPRAITAAGNEFVISANAGGVSFVEGDVTVSRVNGKTGRLLRTDTLEVGDRVTTGENGKVEVMLNPGSFARIGGNSDFQFANTSLDNLLLKLNSGSMILEVYAGDDFKVFVRAPNALMDITRSGVYRIDSLAGGGAKLSVWKGSTVFGASRVNVKTGYAVTVLGNKGTMDKFDRDKKDDLDEWSKLRGKEAAKSNDKLQRRALNNSLLTAFNRGAWNMYNSIGLWVFDPIRSSWFFLPFGSGWRSPYGHWYGYDIWAFQFPYYVYTNPNVTTGGGSGGGAGAGGGTGGGSVGTIPPPPGGGRRTETKGDPMGGNGGGWSAETPLYRRFENTQRTYGDGPVNTGYNNGGRFGGGGYRDNGGWTQSTGGSGGFGGGGGADSKGVFNSPGPVSQPSMPAPPPISRIGSKDDN